MLYYYLLRAHGTLQSNRLEIRRKRNRLQQRTFCTRIFVTEAHYKCIWIHHQFVNKKDSVKIKLCRGPTSEKSDLYQLKMAFFTKARQRSSVVRTELWNDYKCVRNARCWREDSVSLYASTWQSVTLNWHIVCWGGKYDHRKFKPHYFGFKYVLLPVNELSKQKLAMHRVMRKLHELKVRRCTACIIDLNDY